MVCREAYSLWPRSAVVVPSDIVSIALQWAARVLRLGAFIYSDGDSNNCFKCHTRDVKFPERDFGFTTLVQHSTDLLVLHIILCMLIGPIRKNAE